MKNSAWLWALAALFSFTQCAETSGTCYDEGHAEKWEADAYGMKSYVMAFLKSGPNRSGSPEERMKLQEAHMANIDRMAAAGQLVLAGPFLDNTDIRGIYIFNVADTAVAREWTATDPAIEAGSLTMELHPWYGSAALMALNDLHTLVQTRKITE